MLSLQQFKNCYQKVSQLLGIKDSASSNSQLYNIIDFDDESLEVWLKTPYTHTSFAVKIHDIHNRGFVDAMSPLQAFYLGEKLGEAHECNRHVKGLSFPIDSWKFLPSDATHTRICSISRDKKIEFYHEAKNIQVALYPGQLTIHDGFILDFYPRTAHYLGYEAARYKMRKDRIAYLSDYKNNS